MELSVISTMYDEEKGVKLFLEQTVDVLDKSGISYEIIVIDDGSSDGTLSLLKAELVRYPHLRVVELQRNFGQVNALGAGLALANGEWIVMMDGDLQHDPASIPSMFEIARNGFDLVATYRENREETRLRKMITWISNRVNRYLIGVDIRDFGSAFRLFHHSILDYLRDRDGYIRYNTPVLYINAHKTIQIPITQHQRKFGTTKWTLMKFVSFNLDMLSASFRLAYLLIIFSWLGVFTGALLYLTKIFGLVENVEAATAPTSLALSFFQLAMIAFIWREVLVTKQLAAGTPPYVVRQVWSHENLPQGKEKDDLNS